MTSKPGEARLFLKWEAPVPEVRKGDRQGEDQGSTGEVGTLSRGKAEMMTRKPGGQWECPVLVLGKPFACLLPRLTVALLSGVASHVLAGVM